MSKLSTLLALTSIGFGLQVITPAITSAQPTAAFYEHTTGGEAFVLTADSSFVGEAWNDRISAVNVIADTIVTLYEHSDFQGASVVLTAGFHELPNWGGPGWDGTWNDVVSSIRVTTIPYNPSKIVVTVNGSFNPNNIPWWMQFGSPMHAAMMATYGESPYKFHWRDSSFPNVLSPNYFGINSGASELAQTIDTLPQGVDLSIVAHSHGGNVAIKASHMTTRSIRRLVQLGTPVNWDLTRNPSSRVQLRCQVYSTHDSVQMIGASYTQVAEIANLSWNAAYYAYMATDALFRGDYGTSLYYTSMSIGSYAGAEAWIDTTRREGPYTTHVNFDDIPGSGTIHEKLHEPWVWGYAVNYCSLP